MVVLRRDSLQMKRFKSFGGPVSFAFISFKYFTAEVRRGTDESSDIEQ